MENNPYQTCESCRRYVYQSLINIPLNTACMLYAVYPPYSKSPTDLVGHYGYGLPATNLKAPSIYSPAIKSTTCITLPVLASETQLARALTCDDWHVMIGDP